MSESSVILVRHCASQGQEPEAALTEDGARAAEALAESLAGFQPDALYSSPFARAIATIAPYAERVQLTIHLDGRLRERTLSAQPLPNWLEHLERSHDDIDHHAPGGESLRDVRTRGLAVMREIANQHRCAVVVSHGQWIASVLSEIDPAFGFAEWRALRNPDLFLVHWREGAPVRFERFTRSRRTVRAVIVAGGHVLLMQMAFPWLPAPLWITPGGGIERGESELAALSRELAEELGRGDLIAGRELGQKILRVDGLLQHERYQLIECPRFEPTSDALTKDERGWFRGYRWWPIEEVTSDAPCDPHLSTLLQSI